MLGFSNLHVITVHRGEVYVHHFWLLWVCIYVCFLAAKSTLRSGK